MSGKNAKGSDKTAITIVLIAVIFVAVLGGSIFFQLYKSPDFHGFSKDAVPDPTVSYGPGEDATGGTSGGGSYSWENHHVFIIGDSLTQGAKKEIEKVVKNSTIDSKVGRNMSTGVEILRGWQDSGILTEDAIIVICLAHNITGTTVDDAQTIVDMIEPGQSLIMMTGHGSSSMAPANEFIRNLPNLYAYVTVADWDLTIKQSPSLLGDDGIHIAGNQGNVLYADLILRALEVSKPKP